MSKLKLMIAMLGMMLGRPFGVRMKNCRQVAELLSDYLEGEVDGPLRRSIDLHVMACPDCQRYLETFRASQRLVREIRYEEIPADFRMRLHTILADRLKAGH